MQWTSIPSPQLSSGGHFCLLARFVAANSTPDAIVGEVTGNGIWSNVYNSNNIAWKNVTVVDAFQNRPTGGSQIIMRNISRATSQTKLRFDLASGSETFLRSGAIEIDLGRELFALWERGGKKGSGVIVTGRTTIAIREPHAYIDNLKLSPREEHMITFRFPFRTARRVQREFTFHVMQLNLAKSPGVASQITGGETFLIRDAPRRR